jgi:cob(I)alamin adenosyltransferase
MVESLGLTHIYTGDGKGKTTAALGQAVRASGQGLRVKIIQFMKGTATSGEFKVLSQIPGIEIERIGDNFLRSSPPRPEVVATGLTG